MVPSQQFLFLHQDLFKASTRQNMEIVVFYAQVVSIPLEIGSFGYRSKHNHSDLTEICPGVHFTLQRMRNGTVTCSLGLRALGSCSAVTLSLRQTRLVEKEL